jgi:hypothetical protein
MSKNISIFVHEFSNVIHFQNLIKYLNIFYILIRIVDDTKTVFIHNAYLYIFSNYINIYYLIIEKAIWYIYNYHNNQEK